MEQRLMEKNAAVFSEEQDQKIYTSKYIYTYIVKYCYILNQAF